MKNIGIVGVGGFGATVLRSILAMEQEGLAQLRAAVIRNPDKYPDAVAKLRREGRHLYASLDEMIAQEGKQLDIISLPVGIPYHSEMAIRALEAGYDVVLEKPACATVQEVDAMIEAERRTGHFVAIGYQHIQTPAIQAIRREIDDGRLGKIHQSKCYAIWPRGRSYYTRNHWCGEININGRWVLDGPVTNALAHFLHNMFYLLYIETEGQLQIGSVQAELYRANQIPTYDTVCLRAKMSTGAEVQIALSHTVKVNENPIIHIEAENATVDWSMDDTKSVIRYKDGTIITTESPNWGEFNKEVFRDALAVAEGKRERPRSTLQNSRLQVLAVDLAFESSCGVMQILSQYSETWVQPNGDPVVVVPGMEDAIRRTYSEYKMLSELGLPWAQATAPVSAAGYTAFPRDPRTAQALQPLAREKDASGRK